MFSRLKRVLVESYVGVVALGYTLAQCILQFVGLFTTPFQAWYTRVQYSGSMLAQMPHSDQWVSESLMALLRVLLLLLFWYLLLHWLYFSPVKKDAAAPATNPQ
ncbi:MAG TPA: hypothetical protein VGD60_03125 [Candidatus Acidoferrales bacterium]